MNTFRYALSFRATHPFVDLSELCHELDVTPLRIWKAGDRRRTPKGDPLDGVYTQSYCTLTLDHLRNMQLAHAIAVFLVRARSIKPLLARLSESGAEFNLFVGWFTEGNSGARLRWELLRDLAELQISLDLDVYGDDHSPSVSGDAAPC